MKKFTNFVLAGALTLGMAFTSFVAVAPAGAAGNGPNRNANTTTTTRPAARPVTPTPSPALSAEEIAGLSFMREEEKLARDVYLNMADLWDARVFSNIAASEQKHMDAVGTLLTRYGIADPAAGNGIGEFSNAELQALYDDLMVMGSQSLTDALQVGALIEETDIEDLIHELAVVKHSDIKRVYTQLEQGSENHLRAFTSNLSVQGAAYEPQVLDQETYGDIASGTSGNRQGRGNHSTQGQGDGTCNQ